MGLFVHFNEDPPFDDDNWIGPIIWGAISIVGLFGIIVLVLS